MGKSASVSGQVNGIYHSGANRRADCTTERHIKAGEELIFNYGEAYWEGEEQSAMGEEQQDGGESDAVSNLVDTAWRNG